MFARNCFKSICHCPNTPPVCCWQHSCIHISEHHDSKQQPWHPCLVGPAALVRDLGVSPRVSPKTGVSDRMSHGVSPGLFGPRGPECPKSVPRVSPECQSIPDTLGKLSGHFLDTPETGARRAPRTPRGTLCRTPPFSGTLSGRLAGTEGPERPL